MNLTTKLQPVFIIASALVGLLLGYLTGFGSFSVHLIEPFLMVLLFFVFLSVDGRKLREAFHNRRFTFTALAVNFIWTPVFAYLLGRLFFRDVIDMQMGLMMLMVTPCTDWYLVFTALAKGNVALGASILPLNLLLQIVLLPVYLMLFYGGSVSIASGSVVFSIVIVLIVPFALAFACKQLEKRGTLTKIVGWLREKGDDAQLVFLCLAVVSMFASESRSLFENPAMLAKIHDHHDHDAAHAHEGVHEHAHVHAHAEDHDHPHDHEHTHIHSHEHTHANGETHSHPHEHTHTHEHEHHHHAHGEGKPLEELLALMKYMTGHNAAHTHELEELAHEVQHAGQGAAYDEIMEAVRLFTDGNAALTKALDKMQMEK